MQLMWVESRPTELLEGPASDPSPFSHELVMSKAVLQLLLLESVAVHCIESTMMRIPFNPLFTLIAGLDSAFLFARSFDEQHSRRKALKLRGFMAQLSYLPGLSKQEKDSLFHLALCLSRALDASGRVAAEANIVLKRVNAPIQNDRPVHERLLSLCTVLGADGNEKSLISLSESKCPEAASLIQLLWENLADALICLIR